MFGLGMPELIVVMVLALLVFGPKSLPGIGSGLAKAIRGFREGTEKTPRMQTAPESMACSRCGSPFAVSAAFCVECGKKRSEG
jgi:sec-independent protein translocase protein TatA